MLQADLLELIVAPVVVFAQDAQACRQVRQLSPYARDERVQVVGRWLTSRVHRVGENLHEETQPDEIVGVSRRSKQNVECVRFFVVENEKAFGVVVMESVELIMTRKDAVGDAVQRQAEVHGVGQRRFENDLFASVDLFDGERALPAGSEILGAGEMKSRVVEDVEQDAALGFVVRPEMATGEQEESRPDERGRQCGEKDNVDEQCE